MTSHRTVTTGRLLPPRQTGRFIRCEFCGEMRDTSTRYTSPANARRDRDSWKTEHESGACVQP